MSIRTFSFLDRHLYIFVHLKGLLTGGFRRFYYSQWGEDIALAGLFSGKRDGFYVDVGAYHPFHYSNTYLLYKKGWRGVNIDPNPNAIALFRLHRPRDVNINAGVAQTRGELPYFIFNHQACNTFSDSQRDFMLRKSHMRLIKETKVAVAPLQEMLDEYAKGKTIDFLNVDVEGMSMEVLRSIDFSKTSPRVVCIEDDAFAFDTPAFGSEIYKYLTERSYALVAKMGHSALYTRT